jgi:hypothetical protein
MNYDNGKQIDIEDKALFDTYFDNYPPQISEFTFTNLFMWRDYYNLKFLELKNHLLLYSLDYLTGDNRDENKNKESDSDRKIFFFPPIGEFSDKIILDLFNNNQKIEFHRVQENIIQKLKSKNNNNSLNLKFIEDRKNWDYVYKRSKLVKLNGLSPKKRWVRRFREKYNYEFRLLREEDIDCYRKLQLKWCKINECETNPSLEEECKAINEAFDHYSKLKFNGGAIFMEDKCISYTFGEPLNSNTVVIHVEKAITKYDGAYQAINNFFCKNCCEKVVEYINREQDLGDPGLRRAKESYHPDLMVKKYIISKENSQS